MDGQSKGMKLLYTFFLITVTVHTVVLLVDHFSPKEPCSCKKKENG